MQIEAQAVLVSGTALVFVRMKLNTFALSNI